MLAEEEKRIRALCSRTMNSKPQMYAQLPHINDLTEMIRPPHLSYQAYKTEHRNSHNSNNNMIGIPDEKNASRRESTTTLQRLLLVAQALETELDTRRQTDVNGGRVVFSIRMVNMILLIIVNILILTGVGQYSSKFTGTQSLHLTIDKWHFSPEYNLPESFSEMQLNGQYFALTLTVLQMLATAILQFLHVCRVPHSRLLCMCYSFGAVPMSLIVFGMEMHFSACPWLDQFYRKEVLLHNFDSDAPFDAKCGINGWALAGIFSLLSCGLFVGEGLVAAFFRNDSPPAVNKSESLL